MEHAVNLEEGDSLLFKFTGAAKLTFSMSYEMLLEAALQQKLQEIQRSLYQQSESGLQQAQNSLSGGRVMQQRY